MRCLRARRKAVPLDRSADPRMREPANLVRGSCRLLLYDGGLAAQNDRRMGRKADLCVGRLDRDIRLQKNRELPGQGKLNRDVTEVDQSRQVTAIKAEPAKFVAENRLERAELRIRELGNRPAEGTQLAVQVQQPGVVALGRLGPVQFRAVDLFMGYTSFLGLLTKLLIFAFSKMFNF